MSIPAAALPLTGSTATRWQDYLALSKPRIVLFILMSAATGFLLAVPADPDPSRLLVALAGTALAAAGSMALNQFLERDLDARMERTRRRPVPTGRITPDRARTFGAVLFGAGVVLLAVRVNGASAFWAAFTGVWYLAVYTPAKRRTPYGFLVGAVCGATPPLIGWSAAAGRVDVGGWILFGILFLWQVPHTLAIARLYRDDYARAGVPVLPVVDPGGTSTRRQVIASSLALLSVALLPTLVGMAGPWYFLAALGLGLLLLGFGLGLDRLAIAGDRQLLLMTLAYLPLLFGMMLWDAQGLTLW